MKERIDAITKETAKLLQAKNRLHLPGGGSACGVKHQIVSVIALARQALYPEVFGQGKCETGSVAECLDKMAEALHPLLELALDGQASPCPLSPDDITVAFIQALPAVKAILETDIEAAYLGDPAATSRREILLAYPSFEALSIFRMAHTLQKLGVPLLPRMMTEYAHEKTGIDIHPGAEIGSHFFIDHGTGVVIGETAVIGHHVKLYQGVTLGAKSFPLDENGHPIKGIRRHPTIGNHAVIYAGATILGGDTHIGDGAVIGGNVWLTASVEANAIVTNMPGRPKTKAPKQ